MLDLFRPKERKLLLSQKFMFKMFSIVKLTVRARILNTYCINRLHQQSVQFRTGRRPTITHSTLQKPLFLTARLLKVKSGAKPSLKPQYKWDRVPASYQIVYESGLKDYISSLYIAIAVCGVSTLTLVLLRWEELLKNMSHLDGIYFMGGSLLVLLIFGIGYRFARTVIIRIYYNPNSGQFAAVRRTCFGGLRQIHYYPRDVKLKHSGKLTNQDLQQSVEVKIQNQDYYLSADGFSSPFYYNVHLGGDDGNRDLNKSFVSGPRF